MTTTKPGTVRLDTLHQGKYWVDRSGQEHALADMDADYLKNLLGYLERNAERFQELQRDHDNVRAMLHGFDPDFDPPWYYPSPEVWIKGTELAKAVTRELEKEAS